MVRLSFEGGKPVNDRFGRAAGDAVLRGLVERVRHATRLSDLFARLGGEEFVVVLPQVAEKEAEEIVERIRARIEAQPFDCANRQVRVTASFGIAAFDPPGPANLEGLLACADAALYAAKKQGRNRTEVASRVAHLGMAN